MKYKRSKYNIHVKSNNVYYVANTMTGAVVSFDYAEYNFFEHDNFSEIGGSINDLISAGILIDSYVDEVSVLRSTYNRAKYLDDEVSVTICPTLDCNFSCIYCYETSKKGKMSEDVQNRLVEYLKRLIDKGVKSFKINWFGGEPLLYPEIIERLSSEVRALCINNNAKVSFSIISNGYLINEKIIGMFNKFDFKTIQITVDGEENIHNSRRMLKDGKGTFQRIINNIYSLSKSNMNIAVRVNIDSTNRDSFKYIKSLLSNLPNVFCYPSFVTQENNQSDQVRNNCISHINKGLEYSRLYNQNSINESAFDLIGLGIKNCISDNCNSFVVDHEGYLYKCLNDVGVKEKITGSVIKENIDAWHTSAKYLGRDPFSEPECNECAFIPICYGGCSWDYFERGFHSCPPEKYVFGDMLIKTINSLEEEAK